MANFFPATSITDLKAIHGNDLASGDISLLGTSTYASIYYLNATSGATESLPGIVEPTNSAGAKRWIRIYNTASTITVGTVLTGLPKTSAQVTNSGTVYDAIFDFVIPQGIKGIDWKSEYSGTTAYVVQDGVFYNDKCYLCILASTGNLPTNVTYWKELTFGPVIDSDIEMPFVKEDGTETVFRLDGNALISPLTVGATLPISSTGGSTPTVSIRDATNAQNGAATAAHIQALEAATLAITGKDNHHGIESRGALSFNSTDHILTIATGVTYWINGVQKINTGSTSCDIDSYKTLTARTLYWFYFDDTSGTLKCDTSCNLKTKAPVATVFWNGTAGAVQNESHNHTRDIDWHIWSHDTIGARYENNGGFAQTAPTAAADETLNIGIGTIFDEDIEMTSSGAATTMRGWHKYDASSFTFTDYSLPYLGTSGHCYWVDTADYTLKDVDHAKYVCYWVYASMDIDRTIYVIPTHAAAPYNTIALARAETAPSLYGLGINAEIKLIYKWIYRGDAQYQEGVDYRTSAALPAGNTTTVVASSVSSLAHGSVSATNVQAAIEELADEKTNYSFLPFCKSDGNASNIQLVA